MICTYFRSTQLRGVVTVNPGARVRKHIIVFWTSTISVLCTRFHVMICYIYARSLHVRIHPKALICMI